MKNLLNFEDFVNESILNESIDMSDFKKAIEDGKFIGLNPLDKGMVRTSFFWNNRYGAYSEKKYGALELKKLAEATLSIILQKYNDAILLGPKPSRGRSYDWVIEFQGNFPEKQFIAFSPEVVSYDNKIRGGIYGTEGAKFDIKGPYIEKAPNEFGKKYQEMNKFVHTKGKSDNNDNRIGERYTSCGNWDRLLIHLQKII